MPIIYKITCKNTGKSYIGKSENSFETRYCDGRFWAKTHNKQLQDDAYLYGKDNMIVQTLIESNAIHGQELLDLEQYFITKHRTFSPHGYNLRNPGRSDNSKSENHSAPPLELQFSIVEPENQLERFNPCAVWIKWHYESDVIEAISDDDNHRDVLARLQPRSLFEAQRFVTGTIMHFDFPIGKIKLLIVQPWRIFGDPNEIVNLGWYINDYCGIKFVTKSRSNDFDKIIYKILGQERFLDSVISIRELEVQDDFFEANLIALVMAIRCYETTSSLIHMNADDFKLDHKSLVEIGFHKIKANHRGNYFIARSLSVGRDPDNYDFADQDFSTRDSKRARDYWSGFNMGQNWEEPSINA